MKSLIVNLALLSTLALVSTKVFADQPDKIAIETGLDLQESRIRCTDAYSKSSQLYMNDLQWHQSHEQISERFHDIYASGKRLPSHSVYDKESEQFYIPLLRGDFYSVRISEEFISNVVSNIERALKLEYADFVYFSDIGHTHLTFHNSIGIRITKTPRLLSGRFMNKCLTTQVFVLYIMDPNNYSSTII